MRAPAKKKFPMLQVLQDVSELLKNGIRQRIVFFIIITIAFGQQ